MMRALVLALLLAGCQGPMSMRATDLTSQIPFLSTDRPIEFVVTVWTIRF